MTSLPQQPPPRRLGLVIDLDTCVGCQACVVNCKEWNTGGYPAPLSDQNPYGPDQVGAWLNRVHGFEAGDGAAPELKPPPGPAASDEPPPDTRRFEYEEGSSHKFWEIGTEGAEVVIRYGKVGAKARTQVKPFDDEAKAAAFVEKQIKSKTKKGYIESE